MSTNVRQPVRLLRDGRGIYGIGAEVPVDLERDDEKHDVTLILRRDWLADVNSRPHRRYPVLQPIFGGTRGGDPFRWALEEEMRAGSSP
jgi:hypothetical protein